MRTKRATAEGAHRPPEPVAFRVVGEQGRVPWCLLLAGDDGQIYCFDWLSGTIAPLDCADAGWPEPAAASGALHRDAADLRGRSVSAASAPGGS